MGVGSFRKQHLVIKPMTPPVLYFIFNCVLTYYITDIYLKHVLERKTGTSLSLADTGNAASGNSQTVVDNETSDTTTTTADKV